MYKNRQERDHAAPPVSGKKDSPNRHREKSTVILSSLPGFLRYGFCIGSASVRTGYAGSSGILRELLLKSSGFPEELPKNSRRNTEVIQKEYRRDFKRKSIRPGQRLMVNTYVPSRETDIFSCTNCDRPMIKNVNSREYVQLLQRCHFSKELTSSIFSWYSALKVLISFSAIPGLR
jgi:hypothetical protein